MANLKQQIQEQKDLNRLLEQRIKDTEKLRGMDKIEDSTLGKRKNLLQQIENELDDINALKSIGRDIEKETNRLIKDNHNSQASRYNTEKQITANAIKNLKVQRLSNT